MNKIVAGAFALAAATWGFAAVTTAGAEPAHPPATEHCGDKEHGAHNTDSHDCEHPKPATH